MEVIITLGIVIFFGLAVSNSRKSENNINTSPQKKDAVERKPPSSNSNSGYRYTPKKKADTSETWRYVGPSSKTAQENDTKENKTRETTLITSASGIDETDDGLADFNIVQPPSISRAKPIKGSKGYWVNKDERVAIHGRELNGFLYVGGQLNSLYEYGGPEPALINRALAVYEAPKASLAGGFYTDDSLSYWPSYSSLSGHCRDAYLDWLATNRDDKNSPIGFVFLYFYGFERFVIENKDNKAIPDSEFQDIFEEVLRLHNTFCDNRSFASYSANFLELMMLLRPDALSQFESQLPKVRHSLMFKLKLAEQVFEHQKISVPLALQWIKNNDQYYLRTAARRCEPEFDALFTMQFKEKFPEGMKVKPNKTKLKTDYHPASSGIPTMSVTFKELPDPSILTGPLKKIIPIAENITEELAAYSRYLGKANTSREDLGALLLLPPALAKSNASPLVAQFKTWANNVIIENEGLTDVTAFWAHTGMPTPNSLNKKENELLLSLADFANIGIAPDLRYHHAKLKLEGKIVLFSPAHGSGFSPSSAFNQTSIALRLGAMVATIDGFVDAAEKQVLHNVITHDQKLTETEKRSLHAYLIWRLETPPNSAGLKARLAQLSKTDIDFVKHFIIAIAMADGNIDNREIKQIEKFYTSLGLDKQTVTSDIHHFTSSTATAPKQQTDSTVAFSLDEAVLAMHENDTTQAKNILEDIFASNEEETSEPLLSEPQQPVLDENHRKLFDTLCTQEEWNRSEVHELCSALNLMIDGAIETINDWSFELVDAPLLDDDGSIYVDNEILKEIKEL